MCQLEEGQEEHLAGGLADGALWSNVAEQTWRRCCAWDCFQRVLSAYVQYVSCMSRLVS